MTTEAVRPGPWWFDTPSFMPAELVDQMSYAQWEEAYKAGEAPGQVPVDETGFTSDEALAFLRGESNGLTADATTEQVGAMIALVPSVDDVKRLAIPGGEPSKELHLTICYLGEAVKIPPFMRVRLEDSMRRIAGSIPIIDATGFGVAVWNGGDAEKQTAIVLNVGGGELEDAYEEIWDVIKRAYDDTEDIPEQYEPWVSHVCLAYSNNAGLVTQLQNREGPIRFTHLRVAFAGHVTDIPLYDGSDLTSPGDSDMGDEYESDEVGVLYADGMSHDFSLDEEAGLTAADISPEVRRRAAKKGNALPDGSYPIRNVGDLKNAIQSIGRAKNPAKAKALIRRRARELNRQDLIPDTWEVTTWKTDEFAGKKESDVNLPGGNHNLKNYWTRGAGAAKIRWGTDGSFARCVRHLGKYVARPQGLCAEYHKAATGEWPTQGGKHGIPSAVDIGITLDSQPRFLSNFTVDTILADATATADVDVDEYDGSWEGILAVEDVETGDQRKFAAGSITWVNPTKVVAPLQWAPQNLGEHKGSVTVGRINEIWRDASNARVIRGRGMFNLNDEDGARAFQQAKDGFLSGISIDPDQVTDADVELIYPTALTETKSDDGDLAFTKPELTVYHAGRIRGATLVAFPAFIEGAIQLTKKTAVTASVYAVSREPWQALDHEIALGDEISNLVASAAFAIVRSDDHIVQRNDCRFLHHEIDPDTGDVGPANLVACAKHIESINAGRAFGLSTPELHDAYEHLAAHMLDADVEPASFALELPESIVAASIPIEPPLEWFVDPKLSGPTPITVTDDGHVFGHAFVWGTCHTGFADRCVTPPREPDYSFFTTGEVMTASGQRVAVGQITLGTSHAPTTGLSVASAVDHYGNTGTAVADVAAGMDEHGGWVNGSVRPGTAVENLHALRASALSGDWRRIGGHLRMVALLAVNVPGFPIPRVTTAMQDDKQVTLVAAGILDRAQIDFDAEVLKLAGSCGIPLSGMKKKKKMNYATLGLDELVALVNGA
jgi:hypothetical protein